MFRTSRGLLTSTLILSVALTLTACGGGGGGGGGNGDTSSTILTLGSGTAQPFPMVGVSQGGPAVGALTSVSYTAPSSSLPAQGVTVPSAGAGDFHFIELNFNKDLLATSILDGNFIGNDAISIVRGDGTLIRYFLDATGTIDPTNVFPAPNTAPATLRLYIEDPAAPGSATQAALADGDYTVTVLSSTASGGGLSGAGGEQFCLISEAGSCTNDVIVRFPFTVGTDASPLAPASTASSPLSGQLNVARNGDIRVFFDQAVDFQSIVGFNTGTGAPNTTQLDPFMSVPFMLNGPTMGENLSVTYTPPAGEAAPTTTHGFVVYMPDPFYSPTEIRIRFVDLVFTPLQPSDTFPNVQSYGLDETVWENAGLQAPRNANNQKLNLPPVLPLPGSSSSMPAGAAALSLTFFGTMNANATDSSNGADGTLGITDRNRLALQNDLVVSNLTLAVGPPVANNPVGTSATFVADGNRLRVLSSGRHALNGVLLGQPIPVATPLDDSSVLGSIRDIEFGFHFNGSGAANGGASASRNNPAAVIMAGGDPAIPFPVGAPEVGPAPPLGVFLYVADGSSEQVKIFNSYTYQQLGNLVGVPTPGGMTRSLAGTELYVSNREQGTLQRVNINQNSTTFHQVTGIVNVGELPEAVSFQIQGEDIFVLNTGENTMSRITVGGFVERIRLTVGVGARDVWSTPRWNRMGGTGAYQAYISNFFSDSVSIFESESIVPQVFNTNGVDGKIFQTEFGFLSPSYGFSNGITGIGAGFLIANSAGSTVTHTQMVNFNLGPQPGFQGPPAFRTFQTTQTYQAPMAFGAPNDCSLDALVGGTMNVIYPGSSQIAVFDTSNTLFLGSVTTAGNRLYGLNDV